MVHWKLISAIVLVSFSISAAEGTGTYSDDEQAIRAAVESYVKAFNRGDSKAIADHWSDDAVYVVPSGDSVVGRDNIRDAFKDYFSKNKGVKLEASPSSISVESPDRAVEVGITAVTYPGEAPEESSYVATHVKKDGTWKLAGVKEFIRIGGVSHYEHLKDLEWMVGRWVDQDHLGRVETVCEWTDNKNFISRTFTVLVLGRVQLKGTQIIGWDPSSQKIRSWVFDSLGGIGEGTWSKEGNRWFIRASQVLNTGEKASAINIIKRVNDNEFTWQSIGREVGGELLPGIPEFTVVRKETRKEHSGSRR
jgi:uncharacterized protein (TIGR02246 family)